MYYRPWGFKSVYEMILTAEKNSQICVNNFSLNINLLSENGLAKCGLPNSPVRCSTRITLLKLLLLNVISRIEKLRHFYGT
jgi:hypothetical protein